MDFRDPNSWMSQSNTFQPVEGHPAIQSKPRLFKTYDEPEKKKEMTAFTEYRSTDAPPPSLGRAGDIFVRTLNKKEQVYARYSNEPLWRVLESFSNTLLHPVADPQRYLWFTLNRFGWVSEKEKRTMRRVASVHDSIKSMLDLEAKNRKRAGAGLHGPASKRKKIVEDPATTATSATQIQRKPLVSPSPSRSSTSTSVTVPALDLLPLPDITIGSPTKTASTHIPTPTSISLKAPSASVSKSSPKPRVPTAGAKSTPFASPSKVVSIPNIKVMSSPPLNSSPSPPPPSLTKSSISHKRKRVESPSPTPPESPSALRSFSLLGTGTNSGDANVDTHTSSPDNGGDIDSKPNPYTSPDRIRLERLQKQYREKEDEVRMLREELRLSQSQEEKDKSDSKSTKCPRHPSKNDSSPNSPSHLFDRDISPEIGLPERKQQQQDLNQRLTPPLTPLIGQGPSASSFSANASRQRVPTPANTPKTNANTITNASTSVPTPSHRPPPLKLGSVSGMSKPTPTPPTSTPHLDLSQFDIVPVPSLRQAKTKATAVVKAARANKKAGDMERRKEKDSRSTPSSARNPNPTLGAKTLSTPKSIPTSASASAAKSRPKSVSTTVRGLPSALKPKPVSLVSKEKEKIKGRNKVTTPMPMSKPPSASMTVRSSSTSTPASAHNVSRASSATKAETQTSTTHTSLATANTEDADVKVKLEDSACKSAASTSAIPGTASGAVSSEAECIDLTLDSDEEEAGIVTQTQALVKPDNETGAGAMTGVGVKEEDGEGLALPTWSASFAAVEETDTEADGEEDEGGEEEERDELRSSPGLDSESESGQAQADMAEEPVNAVTESKSLGQSTVTTVPASEVKQEPSFAEVKTESVQASLPIRPVNSAGKDDSEDDIMEIDVHEFSASVRASKGKARASASMLASVGPRGSRVAASVGADYEEARGVEAETIISGVDDEVGGDEMKGEQEEIRQPPVTKTETETKQHGSSPESAQDDPCSLDFKPSAPSHSVTTSSTVPSVPAVKSTPPTPSPSPLPPDFRRLELVFQLDTDNSPFSGPESKRCIKECDDELQVKGHRLRVSHLRVVFYPMKEDESDLENERESVSEGKAERETETGYNFVCMLCLAGKTPTNTHFNRTHTPLDIARHVEDVHADSVNQILQFSEAELVSLMEKM
ncbi:hypothetical protein VKT23_009510 [Stygiomarasmius scandens]|uniref:Uncharacterized protein n=1 Tax=Marasmiellus scandens TaxID=2682957 RepID=A0ABR1JDZ5_9AGAR